MNNNFIVPEAQGLSEGELLEFYDNPRNFEIKDCRETAWENSDKEFPMHCFLSLTHGTYAVQEKIRRATNLVKRKFSRLMKNFSDFGTRKMTKKMDIPNDQIISSKKSRIIGDENRENQDQNSDANLSNGKKFIRTTDFNEKTIVADLEPFREEGKIACEVHHENITIKHKEFQQKYGGSIQFDIHDTDIRMMDYDMDNDQFRRNKKTGELEGFPYMNVGGLEGTSCDPEILEYFCDRVSEYLGFIPSVDAPYKGGYVTQKHGKQAREKGELKRNVIQVELARYLYMKTSTQEVDWERMEIIGEGLKRAIADTGIKFGKEYFETIK